ncbi:alpha/beta hydrolase [Legionella bozemanae]|uniref:Thermostable monoacylglycerol lipase n=1 Tax=Legionella bozemanae TaxID=447 RepID=A0A0W0S2H9_LEGBO|nr:alpha/beta hydrolase [Legionella bozemanae]KTC77715.1 Thermostable monoacylglycerol lipase [Legionella bozemanae]STO33873.1 Thermostable monoacylglycerol lipase [Legionella bozemanae]
MRTRLFKLLKSLTKLVCLCFVILLGLRIFDSQRGPALELWHTYVPKEKHAKELDKLNWAQYIEIENALFDAVRTEVTEKLNKKERVPVNRYFSGSPVYPEKFSTDWNRSYIREPQGPAVGAVVLLHGLTDSPYSLRHIARRYVAHGYVAIAIRLPAHGTVPAALTDVKWEDWLAATRLAVREARRRIGPSQPLHLVGFSNGGALALKYALDSLENKQLTRPDKIILISPMIGVTRFARFAGFAALPAVLPPFAKAAWLSILPEFNPFKYNSFPVNGASQSHRLTAVLQQQIVRLANEDRLIELPSVLTFQSVMDFTVSTRAIITAFYANLPANGSELILFDLNRAAKLGLLLRPSADTAVARLLNKPPRKFRTVIITNATDDSIDVVERVTEAGTVNERVSSLGLAYPRDVYSLSHVAIPFPVNDSLYGLSPDSKKYGIQLGALASRGERNVLIISLDSILRLSSNPFFPYMIKRIEEHIPSTTPKVITVSK